MIFCLAGSLVSATIVAIFAVRPFAVYLILIGFLFAGGFYTSAIRAREPSNSIKQFIESGQIVSGDPIEVEGVVYGKPELSVGGFYLILSVDKLFYKNRKVDTSGAVRFFAPARDEQIQKEFDELELISGARIRVGANLTREEHYRNPGGISYVEILDQKGIDATGIIKSPLLIERLGNEVALSPLARVYDYRQDLIQAIRAKFSVSTSGILIASLLGNRNHLTNETAEIFRNGGTFHVLVISGLHITFLGGIFLLIVRRFTRNRLLQFSIVSAALWIYAFGVGAEIPVVRAALMLTILLFSFVVNRKGNLLNSLGACALLILIWRPEDIFSQSFHLTFASLFGIVAFAFPLIEKMRGIGGWYPSVANPFPPMVHQKLKAFCEILYWSELRWKKTLAENVWDCKLTKSRYAGRLEDRGLQWVLRWSFEGILVTIAVQICLLPFLVVYFHRISFGSIFLNLWVGIFLVLQNVSALIGLIFGLASKILAIPFIKLAEVSNWLLLSLPKVFIVFDLASTRVPIYSGDIGAIYYLYFVPVMMAIILLNNWNPFEFTVRATNRAFSRRRQIALITVVLFSVLFSSIVIHPYSEPPADGMLTVNFLDVGQGDSALVTFPNGETMLIDGGGKHNFAELIVKNEDGEIETFEPDSQGVGETVVSEFLWENGYSHVDYLVATHADADHIQGLIAVTNNFSIREALSGKGAPDDENFSEFRTALVRKNIPLQEIASGDEFEIGGVKISVLNPDGDQSDGETSNDGSVVLKFVYGARRFLFTGDIEKNTENRISSRNMEINSEIVKVAHHGSRTSSTEAFVNSVQAQYAVIPVGRNSPFGHPNSDVVERWKNSGAKVLTTGERGTVTISTDGKNLEIQTYTK